MAKSHLGTADCNFCVIQSIQARFKSQRSCFRKGKYAELHHQSGISVMMRGSLILPLSRPANDHAPNLHRPSRRGPAELVSSMKRQTMLLLSHVNSNLPYEAGHVREAEKCGNRR